MSYEFGGEVLKTEINGIYAELDKPEEPEGVGPFFEDHLDGIRKAIDVLLPALGSSRAKIKVLVKGLATPGHCADNDGNFEDISITLSVVEDASLDPDLVPPGDQTVTDRALYENALVDAPPVEETKSSKKK